MARTKWRRKKKPIETDGDERDKKPVTDGDEREAGNEREEADREEAGNEREEVEREEADNEREEGVNEREEANEEDDEEVVDRYEYEIDDGVDNFVDDEPVGRNCIPESSDDEEDSNYPRGKVPVDKDDSLALGTVFYTGYEFKEAVLKHALNTSENIRQDRWDKTKLSYCCGIGGGCKWRVYCSYDKPKQKWIVKTRCDSHSCTPNGKCKLLKGPVIAKLFLDKLREDGNLMPEKIQEEVKDNWKLISTRNQCQRGRLLALKWLEKEYAEQFEHLRGYVEEILSTNPGSHAMVETSPNSEGEDVFMRFYVCFANLRDSWKVSCRPIVGVDGTFLKSAVKGILLTAVGHDANNQIYPIAWALVQSENTDNWMWFIKNIKADLELGLGFGAVIISDRNRGLITAVKEELPNIEHRMCVKHIIENLKKRHANKDLLKPLIWNLAWSWTPTAYEENLQKVRSYSIALYDDVLQEDPKSWCLVFYNLGTFCSDVDNNSTESFNSTITKARGKAVVPMLETIRRQAMKRINKRHKKSMKHQPRCTKYVVKILAEEKEHAEKCETITCTHGIYEVRLYGHSYNVNTTRKTCTCAKWQISGILCAHAYGAMIDVGLDVEEYVSCCFSTSMWRNNYNSNIQPVRGPRFWMKSGCPLVTAAPEPTLPGRKKKKKKKFPRKKGKLESPKKKIKNQVEKLSRNGRVIHCGICGDEGHNAATCKLNRQKKRKKTDAKEGNNAKKKVQRKTQDYEAEVCSSQVSITQQSQPQSSQTQSRQAQPSQPLASQTQSSQSQPNRPLVNLLSNLFSGNH